MGSSPKMPYYDEYEAQKSQDKVREQARQDLYSNYQSGLGGYSWDPETNTIKVNYNQNDQNRLALIGSGIANLNMNPDEATQAYFDNAMSNIQPQIDRYREKTSADLINKGIPIGSRAYNQVQEEVDKNVSQALENAYVQSRSQALSDLSAQIGNVGNLQSQIYQPQAYAGIGATGLQDLYNNKFQSDMDIYNAKMGTKNSKASSIMGGIGTVAGGLIGAYFGGPMGAAAGSSVGGAAGQAAGNMVS